MGPAEDWEKQLRDGLDAASDLGAQAPPNLADLQMLVVQVQQEQRAQTLRDLALFWGCAAILIAGGLYTLQRQPWAYLVFQVTLASVLLAVVGLGAARRKRVTQ